MIVAMFLNIRNFFKYLTLQFIDFIIKRKRVDRVPGTLLLIRLDAIGDYVLFRNFLKILSESEQYKNYYVTLCGNIAWKELAEALDKNTVYEFIWIDRNLFLNNLSYKYRILKQIYSQGFEKVVDTIHSREILFGDAIVKSSNAIEKIGSEGSIEQYAKWKRKIFSDRIHTKYIPASEENLFEFFRNKEFFERLLESSLNINRTSIDISKIVFDKYLPEKYVVLFPGAGEIKRRWDIKNFIRVAEFLVSEYSMKLVVALSTKEKPLAQEIKSTLKENIIDYTGVTSLSQLAKLLSGAELLISNDTSAVHFAAAVGTPFICISSGKHFGRFHPYPKALFDKGHYIYPPEIMDQIDNVDFLEQRYRFNSGLDINSVDPEKVNELITRIL